MIVEFVGEAKIGKTTASIVMANGYAKSKNGVFAVIDTTPGQESYPIFCKVVKGSYTPFLDVNNDIDGNLYYNSLDLNSIRSNINTVIKYDDIKSIVIDSSDYLMQMAVAEYLKETGHSSVYPPTEWRIVRQKVIDLFMMLMKKKGLLIIFTSPVKDEYVDVYDGRTYKSVKTGKKIPAGFEKLSYIVDVRVGIGFDKKKMSRYYKVMLSRYFDVLSADLSDITYYGNDIDFDKIVKLITGNIKEVNGK